MTFTGLNGVKCVDFHDPSWTHKRLSTYWFRYVDGTVLTRTAFDYCDALDSVPREGLSEYGGGRPQHF